jgi:hypothetical protein
MRVIFCVVARSGNFVPLHPTSELRAAILSPSAFAFYSILVLLMTNGFGETPPLPAAFHGLRGGGIMRTAGPAIMKRSGRDVVSIVLGLLLGLLVLFALYFLVILGFAPTARPPAV